LTEKDAEKKEIETKLNQLREVMGGEKLGRKYPVKRLMDRVNKLGKRSPILCTGLSL